MAPDRKTDDLEGQETGVTEPDTAEAAPAEDEKRTDPSPRKAKLQAIGGTQSDEWNLVIARQLTEALWFGNADEETRNRRIDGAVLGLTSLKPRDAIEAMIAAQLIPAHNASMECFRRAMLPEQTFEGRSEALSQANRLSRTCAMLVEALNRHRGKGQQKVVVKHVHVHEGGQAVVGIVEGGKAGRSAPPGQPRQIAPRDEQPMPAMAEEQGGASIAPRQFARRGQE